MPREPKDSERPGFLGPREGVDLTQGPIVRGILAFAVPLLLTSIVQQLYPTVDLLFVGNVLGTASTAALGVGSLLITCLVTVFVGFSVGVNVKVANLFGAGERASLRDAVFSSVVLAAAGGALLLLVGELLAESFIAWMAVPPESQAESLVYLRFAVVVAVPLAFYNVCSGALRGMGDSRTPLVAQFVGGVCNIVANWLALCVLGWGIAGCAVATVVSNGVAAAIVVADLLRKGQRDGGSRAIDGRFILSVLAFGAPIAVQSLAITLSNIAVQYQVDLLGVEAIAAFVVYLKVELPIYYVILAVGQATTTFVAQNHGAGNSGRCNEGIRVCQVLCLVLTVIMSIVMLAVGYWAFWLFDKSEAVIAYGLSIIGITFPFYFLYAVLEVQGDAMRGFGHSLGPSLVVIANICVVRVCLVVAVGAMGWGIAAIAATYPITWGLTAIMMVVLRLCFIRFRTR